MLLLSQHASALDPRTAATPSLQPPQLNSSTPAIVVVFPPLNATPTSHVLSFIHIPKTGGTQIEDYGLKIGMRWGLRREDWPQGPAPLCAYDWNPVPEAGDALSGGGSTWHVPPRVWAKHPRGGLSYGEHPYDGQTTFCVVRNPSLR